MDERYTLEGMTAIMEAAEYLRLPVDNSMSIGELDDMVQSIWKRKDIWET